MTLPWCTFDVGFIPCTAPKLPCFKPAIIVWLYDTPAFVVFDSCPKVENDDPDPIGLIESTITTQT